jgi:hypothetical protein
MKPERNQEMQQATSLLVTFDNRQFNQNNEAPADSTGICKYQVDETFVWHNTFNGQKNHQMLKAVAVACTVVSCAIFDTCI